MQENQLDVVMKLLLRNQETVGSRHPASWLGDFGPIRVSQLNPLYGIIVVGKIKGRSIQFSIFTALS